MKRRNLVATTSVTIAALLGMMISATSAVAAPERDQPISGTLYVAHGVVFDQSFEPVGDVDAVGERLRSSGDEHLQTVGDQLPSYQSRQADAVAANDPGAAEPPEGSSPSLTGIAGIGCGGKAETFVRGEWNRAPWPATGIRSGHSALRCGRSSPNGGGWSHIWIDGHRADFARQVASSGGPTDDKNTDTFIRSFIITQTLDWPDGVASIDRNNSYQYSTYIELCDTSSGSMRSFTAYVAVGRTSENVVTAWPSGALGD